MQPKLCAACEGPVAAAGRKSKTGIYYCSKVECRRERDRLRAQRWREKNAPPVYPTTEEIRRRINQEIAAEHAAEQAEQAERLRIRLALRQKCLDGGMSLEEVDEEFPLPA